MKKEIKVDKGVYLIDDETKTYYFLRRNHFWKRLSPIKSLANKLKLKGYKRVLVNKSKGKA